MLRLQPTAADLISHLNQHEGRRAGPSLFLRWCCWGDRALSPSCCSLQTHAGCGPQPNLLLRECVCVCVQGTAHLSRTVTLCVAALAVSTTKVKERLCVCSGTWNTDSTHSTNKVRAFLGSEDIFTDPHKGYFKFKVWTGVEFRVRSLLLKWRKWF